MGGFVVLSKQQCTWLCLVGRSSAQVGLRCSRTTNDSDHLLHFSNPRRFVAAVEGEIVQTLSKADGASSRVTVTAAVLKQVQDFCLNRMPLTIVCQEAFC